MNVPGIKLKMTHFFKGTDALGVTPVRLVKADDLEYFKLGDRVKVTGVMKGRGFAGVVKRHGFHGGPATHGQKNRQRAPGSIGNTSPQRVLPGRKMAGHMGAVNITTKNLLVVDIKSDKGVILLFGSVPGNTGGKVALGK